MNISRFIPEFILGDREYLKKCYQSQYGKKDSDASIEKAQRKNAFYYMICIGFLILIILNYVFSDESETIVKSLKRPGFGEMTKEKALTAELEGENLAAEKGLKLRIAPVEMTEEQIDNKLKKIMVDLPEIIKGENERLDNVKNDLYLPEELENGQVRITWSSDRPDLIDDSGKYNRLGKDEDIDVNLTLNVEMSGYMREAVIPVKLNPSENVNKEAVILRRLPDIVKEIESDRTKKELILPESLPGGIKVSWKNTGKEPPFEALFLVAILFPLIYISRHRYAEKELKDYRKQLNNSVPDFIDKLTLLLNAGMVAESALMKIAVDYREHREFIGKNPLYESLLEINRRVEQGNCSIKEELKEFARLSGSREIMRIVAIIEDNLDKGSTLSEKLETESGLLWINRKKQSEEEGRLAETKLTLPLMLLLLALILIAVAPVMLKM